MPSSKTNQTHYYKVDYEVLLSHLPTNNSKWAGQAIFRALKIPDPNELAGDWSFSRSVLKTIRLETARTMVLTAIALKRHQELLAK